jgi:sterol desaturase/sphingolipid hydroxylase (fatty acid hydroxylase superfamily)/opacity protein-like surface antigen
VWFLALASGSGNGQEDTNMIITHTNFSFQAVALTVFCSCLAAEFAGYWLHRLLHSDKIPFLSRGHLIHHFLVYGPGQPMRSPAYKEATGGRFSIGSIGLEWLVPSGMILILCWVIMALLDVPEKVQAISLCVLLGWPIFMFNYLHDRMHLRDFWMLRVPVLRTWYIHARKLHDIHHLRLNNDGRMNANFGIGFFLFDRLFQTIEKRHTPFNLAGYRAARKRYGLVGSTGYEPPRLLDGSPWHVRSQTKVFLEISAKKKGETMRWPMAVVIALLSLGGVPGVHAQRIEVTPFFGARMGGTVNLAQQNNPDADFLKIRSSSNYGLIADVSFLRHFQGEFMWSRQPTSLTAHNPNDGTFAYLSKLNLDTYQFGITYQFRKPEAKLRPFIVLGAGFPHYGVPDINGKRPFSGSLGGGVKYYFTRNVGIRLETRWMQNETTFNRMGTCVSFTDYGGGTYTCALNNSANQAQANVGLIFRFR